MSIGDVGRQLEVYYEHGADPVYIRTPDEADALLDRVAARYRDDWPVLLEINIADSVGTEQLYAGVYRDLGVLFYSSPEHPGCYSMGEQTTSGHDLTYYYMNHERPYPADSQIPLAAVRSAVREFMASGGRRPGGVSWQSRP